MGGVVVSVAGSNKTCVGLHKEFPVFLPDFNQIWILDRFKLNSSSIKFHENPSSGSLADTCGRKDRHTDGHDEVYRRFSQLYERGRKLCILSTCVTYCI